jgi:hypothetical protein
MQHACLEMAQMISDLKQALWMDFLQYDCSQKP